MPVSQPGASLCHRVPMGNQWVEQSQQEPHLLFGLAVGGFPVCPPIVFAPWASAGAASTHMHTHGGSHACMHSYIHIGTHMHMSTHPQPQPHKHTTTSSCPHTDPAFTSSPSTCGSWPHRMSSGFGGQGGGQVLSLLVSTYVLRSVTGSRAPVWARLVSQLFPGDLLSPGLYFWKHQLFMWNFGYTHPHAYVASISLLDHSPSLFAIYNFERGSYVFFDVQLQ